MDSTSVIEQINKMQAANISRDEILREAVLLIHAANPLYNWTGIYLLDGNTLILHNFIGKPTDHTHIQVGVGVCGTAVSQARDMNVPDVTSLENYLACSLETRAEIVVLIKNGGQIFGQIDIDSDQPKAFTGDDESFLSKIADRLAVLFI